MKKHKKIYVGKVADLYKIPSVKQGNWDREVAKIDALAKIVYAVLIAIIVETIILRMLTR